MSIQKLFETIEQARETAHWRSAFGEPQVIGDKTIIPVAQVGYGYGLGFGRGTGPSEEEGEPASEGEGGGAGGGASARPLGAIVVTPEHVYFEETEDATKIALAAMGLGALLILQLAKTLRTVFGHA